MRATKTLTHVAASIALFLLITAISVAAPSKRAFADADLVTAAYEASPAVQILSPNVGTLVGPVYPPPLGNAFNSTGTNPGRAAGNTWFFVNTMLAGGDPTFWGPEPNLVKLGFCSEPSVLNFNAGLSNRANGVLVWSGVTCQGFNTRFTLTITDNTAQNNPVSLIDPATLGISGNVGGLVVVTSPDQMWRAQFRFDASTSPGGGTFAPAMDVYDQYHANNPGIFGGGTALQSFDAGFWYINSPPQVSGPGDRRTPPDTATGPIPFNPHDFEGANMIITATSDNQTLVPDANIVLGGSGDNRTVSITPASGQLGTAAITLHVSDGTDTTNATFNLTVGNAVAGTVDYGVGASVKHVPHVVLTAAGSPGGSSQSDLAGAYSISPLSGGAYTVTPSKTGDVNGIAPFDATLILRELAAPTPTFTANQTVAADTNGNGTVQPFDVTQLLRYLAGAPPAQTGFAGTWKFSPSSRTYNPLSSSLASENYAAILVGDINGNWVPPTSFAIPEEQVGLPSAPITVLPAAPAAKQVTREVRVPQVDAPSSTPMTVSLPTGVSAANGSSITIPVTLSNPGNNGISGYVFAVLFDPSVLQPTGSPTSTAGTLSSGASVGFDTSTAGRLGVSAAAGTSITGSGTLINLNFTVVGTAPSSTSLNFQTSVSPPRPEFDDDVNGDPISTTPSNGSFSVSGGNAAPTISNVTDKVTQKDTATGAIAFTIGDADDPTGNSLVMSGSSGNTTLVPNANVVFGGTGNNRTVTITPAAGLTGTALITLTVTDPQNATATDTFNLKVNAPPHFDVNTGLTVNQGSTGAFSAAILNTTDADNTPAQITYTVAGTTVDGTLKNNGTPLGVGGTFTQADVNNGLVTYTHDDSNNFSDFFQISIADSDGGIARDGSFTSFNVNITITPVNHPPVAINGSGSTGIGAAFNGTFAATDPDTTPAVQTLTRRITINGTKGTAVLNNATTGAFTYTPNAGQTGNDTITFQVNDGVVDSVNPGTFTITIVNQAPTAQNGSGTTNEGIPLNASASATDPDQPPQTLTFVVASPPTKGSVVFTNSNTGAFTYTPNTGAIGNDSFTFTVSDGIDTSSPATFSIFIRPRFDAGDLFITNTTQTQNGSTGNVIQIDPANGMQAVIATGGNLGQPQAIAIDRFGRLIIAVSGNNNSHYLVRVIPQSGSQSVIPTVPTYQSIVGLAIGTASDDLFVSDPIGGAIYELNGGTGAIVRSCTGLPGPAGLAFDNNGLLIVGFAGVLANQTSRISSFNMATCTETQISAGGNILVPVSLSIDSSNNIIVGDAPSIAGPPPPFNAPAVGGDQLVRIDRSTNTQVVVSTAVGQPSGVVVKRSTNEYFSVDGLGVTVYKTTAAGTTTVAGTGDNLTDPYGVAIVSAVPTAAGVSVSGRVMGRDGFGIRNAVVSLRSPSGEILTAVSNSFGFYHLTGVQAGGTYILMASARGFGFPSRVISVSDELTGEDLYADR